MASRKKRQIIRERERRQRNRVRTAALCAAVLVALGVYFHYETAIKCAEVVSAIYGLFELLLDASL